MAKARFIYNNLVDKATVSATNTHASFPVSNLKNDTKGLTWRTTAAISTVITVSWATIQRINCIAFAFSNLTNDCEMSIVVKDSGDAVIYSSGAVSPVVGNVIADKDFSILSANSYSQGLGNYGSIWFPSTLTTARSVEITITDPSAGGYFEISRLLVGEYWEPTYNVSFGLSLSWQDTTESRRTQAGNLVSQVGSLYKQMTFDLSYLTETDRDQFVRLIRSLGTRSSLYVNLFPGDTDPEREQLYQIYGRMGSAPTLAHPLFSQYTTSLTIDEV